MIFLALVLFACVVSLAFGYFLGTRAVEPRLRVELAQLRRDWRRSVEQAAKRMRIRGYDVRAQLIEDAHALAMISRGKRPATAISATLFA